MKVAAAMADIATLGVKIDASTVDSAATKLDNFANAGARAESQMKKTESATEAFAKDIAMLKSSVDPAGYALDKVNAELREADTLFKLGAISAADYGQAQLVLNARADAFAAKQGVMNARLIQGAGAARLTGAEALNLSRQFADIGVSAAMGMNPLMILIQQGPQIADIMKTSGMSIKEVIVELLRMTGLITVATAANDNLAVATGAQTAANTALAASANAAAAAEGRLAEASGVAASGAARAAVSATAATAANGAMGASATAAGAATTIALAPIAVIAGVVLIAVGLLAGAFALFANEAEKGLGNVQKEFGFTEKQMDKLKEKGTETGYTIGDVMSGTAATISDVFREEIDAVKGFFTDMGDWISSVVGGTTEDMIVSFIAALMTIKQNWSKLPALVGDAAISATNAAIQAIEDLVNASTRAINSLIGDIPEELLGFGKIKETKLGRVTNPYAGTEEAFTNDYYSNKKKAGGMLANNMGKARAGRITEDAGEGDAPNKTRDKKAGKSDAEREYENQVKAAKDFIESLKEETDQIGKNEMHIKSMAATKAAAKVLEAGLTEETTKLSLAILAQQKAWEVATANEALRKLKEELTDSAEATEFETSMIGKNNEARAVAMAQREIDLKLKELDRTGIAISSEMIATETARILDNARARGKLADATEATRQVANDMREVHDAVREATSAFGELFGTAGQGFADLVGVITNYKDRQLEAEAEIAAAREKYKGDSVRLKEEEARIGAKMARDEISYYGDMISAAKGFFKEKSTGYKVLEAVERAYRAYQMISMVIEAAMTAKSIVLDGAKTTSSVANSGLRAAADGVAAIAKAIASLPFPLNILAGAATAAALIAFGVKVFGGKGGGGATSIAEKEAKQPTYSGPVDEYGAPTSSYSVLRPGRTTVANDNGQVASAPGMAAGRGSSSGVSIGDTYVTVQGNVDSDVMPSIVAALEANRKQTVQEARQAAAADRAESNSRQRIGGG